MKTEKGTAKKELIEEFLLILQDFYEISSEISKKSLLVMKKEVNDAQKITNTQLKNYVIRLLHLIKTDEFK
jgi:hypothetical protein